MHVFDAIVTPAQGGSLRLFLSNKKRSVTKRCNQLILKEKQTNLNSLKKSLEYRDNVLRISNKLRNIVLRLLKEGKTIAGYGAAAKGMTILKCSRIGNKLQYFVDDSPAKQGFYSPVDHVPIISRKQASKKLPDYFIILAPNYSDVIISKERNYINKGGKFIIPKGEIKIV